MENELLAPNARSKLWYTEDEIKFLKDLGTHARRPRGEEDQKAYRLKLLNRYREAMKSRVRWDKLDRIKIGQHIDNLIAGGIKS